MTPSTRIGPPVTLDPSIINSISQEDGRKCCSSLRDPELTVQNNEITIKTDNIFKRLFCCACTAAQRAARKAELTQCRDAFTRYLKNTYTSETIEAAQKFLELKGLQTFQLSHAQILIQKADEIERRYQDINSFIIWLNWRKVYQELSQEMKRDSPDRSSSLDDFSSGSLKEKQAYTPKNLHIKMKDAKITKLGFKEIYRMLAPIPISGIPRQEFTLIVDRAKILFQKETVTSTISYIDVQKKILRLMISEGGQITDPEGALISSDLIEEIEGFESVKELNKEQWERLLIQKKPYITPSQRPAASSLILTEAEQKALNQYSHSHSTGKHGKHRSSSHGSFFNFDDADSGI